MDAKNYEFWELIALGLSQNIENAEWDNLKKKHGGLRLNWG
jgi:hypothetical protein